MEIGTPIIEEIGTPIGNNRKSGHRKSGHPLTEIGTPIGNGGNRDGNRDTHRTRKSGHPSKMEIERGNRDTHRKWKSPKWKSGHPLFFCRLPEYSPEGRRHRQICSGGFVVPAQLSTADSLRLDRFSGTAEWRCRLFSAWRTFLDVRSARGQLQREPYSLEPALTKPFRPGGQILH